MRFRKKGTEMHFEMDVQVPEDDDLHACADLLFKDDSVKLIPEVDPSEVI